MSETVDATALDETTVQQNQAANETQKSALKSSRTRRASARKVVISDAPSQIRSVRGATLNNSSAQGTQNGSKTGPGEEQVGPGTNKSLLGSKKRTSKPAYLQSLNESEKQANFKIIDSMNKKIWRYS